MNSLLFITGMNGDYIKDRKFPEEFGSIMGLIFGSKLISNVKKSGIDYVDWWMNNKYPIVIYDEIMKYENYVKKYKQLVKDKDIFMKYFDSFTEEFKISLNLYVDRNYTKKLKNLH